MKIFEIINYVFSLMPLPVKVVWILFIISYLAMISFIISTPFIFFARDVKEYNEQEKEIS